MPPLRERISDLPSILDVLSVRHQADGEEPVRWTRDAVRALCGYSWPGNVRELNNLVERLSILHPERTVDLADLPLKYRQSTDKRSDSPLALDQDGDVSNLKEKMESIEKRLIASALSEADNVVANAAKLLNLRRTTLVEKIKKYDLRDNR